MMTQNLGQILEGELLTICQPPAPHPGSDTGGTARATAAPAAEPEPAAAPFCRPRTAAPAEMAHRSSGSLGREKQALRTCNLG